MTGHPEKDAILDTIAKSLLNSGGGRTKLSSDIGELLRGIFDDVINTPKTGRRLFEELEKTEKTYIGTRVEIELRHLLNLAHGKVLDYEVAGVEVDLKFSVGTSWMIPREAVGRACMIMSADEEHAWFSLGLFMALPEYLGAANQDKKCGINKAGRESIRWLAKDEQYPPNFWQSVSQSVADSIVSAKGGNGRVIALFREIQDRPIPRKVIADVAMQQDPMRRSRADKTRGTRARLAKETIVLLCGDWKQAQDFIAILGLPPLRKGQWMSHRLVGDENALAQKLDLL